MISYNIKLSWKEMEEINLITYFKSTIIKIINLVSGPKILIVDDELLGMINLVLTKKEITLQNIILCEKLDQKRTISLDYAQAFILIRPTRNNFDQLSLELQSPFYKKYNIIFTDYVNTEELQKLSNTKAKSRINIIQEFYIDYWPEGPKTFTINLPSLHTSFYLERSLSALFSVMLLLKKKPYIRFQQNSLDCQTLAQTLHQRLINPQFEELYHNYPHRNPLILILDRKDDPITPLLHQWTYQAMIHELIGIYHHHVKFNQKSFILDRSTDDFFNQQLYHTLGEFPQALNQLKHNYISYEQKIKDLKQSQSLDQLKEFLEIERIHYEQLKSQFIKHVDIIDQFNKFIDTHHLYDVSKLQQEIISSYDHSYIINKLNNILIQTDITILDRLKLVLLYALRYENEPNNAILALTQKLIDIGVSQDQLKLIPTLLKYRFKSSNPSFTIRAISYFKSFQKFDHILMNHKPLLSDLLTQISNQQLSLVQYPYLTASTKDPITDVIIYILGGLTYEEERIISQFKGLNIIIGSNIIHNSTSFLTELLQL